MEILGFLIKKSFVDVDGLCLCLQNGGNSPQKIFNYINIYFNVLKLLDKFLMISNIELKIFQINLMLELFMCLRLILLELVLNFIH
jgi:hypothetical protein